MVTKAENQLLTQSGPGTPGGAVLRSYWQPAALSEELDSDRPVTPVRLLGEDLVLFRDDDGHLGLLGRSCPHRGVDLAAGRLEDGGLRCPFHGWLFDRDGTCTETPAEPPESTFHTRVCQLSYPVVERNGIVWAWLGEGEAPDLPGLDSLAAPAQQVFAFKGMWSCNWLQAQEVGLDPSHAAFLHRFLEDDDHSYGMQFRDVVADTDVTVTRLMREASAPDITAERTSYGFRTRTLRDFNGQFTHVRVSNCIFPNAITIAMSREMTITQWHVPIDDTSCYWYSMFVSYGEPVDSTLMREQRIGQVIMPDYRSKTGAADNWGFDANEQRVATYTGLGSDINIHDQWAVESAGAIYDRSTEHLSPTDVGIRTHRRLLLAALRDPNPETLIGAANPGELRGPAAIDAVTSSHDYDNAWRTLEGERRETSGWAPALTD